jgi:chromosome segregation ATPase
MTAETINTRNQLADCARELQQVKAASEAQDVVPASDFNALKDELSKAVEEAGGAQARLSESIKTREDLEHENESNESHIKELDALVGELQTKIEGLEEEHNAALEAKDEEKQMALESAAADLTKIIESLKAEKAEIQLVADRVEKAEEASRMNQEKRDFYEDQYKEVLAQKKKLHNKLEDLKGKVRVYARIRPISQKEVRKSWRQR